MAAIISCFFTIARVLSIHTKIHSDEKMLIRLHSHNECNVVPSDSEVSGHSSDGKEIVAVWTDDSLTWFRGDEKGVVGKFEFLGSGAGGGLGEQWKLFAVVSALHMRQVGLQQAQTTASSAAVNA